MPDLNNSEVVSRDWPKNILGFPAGETLETAGFEGAHRQIPPTCFLDGSLSTTSPWNQGIHYCALIF